MRSLYLVSLRSKPIHIFSRRTDAETFIRKAEAKRAPIRDAQHHQYILEKSQQSEVEKTGAKWEGELAHKRLAAIEARIMVHHNLSHEQLVGDGSTYGDYEITEVKSDLTDSLAQHMDSSVCRK